MLLHRHAYDKVGLSFVSIENKAKITGADSHAPDFFFPVSSIT